VYDDSITAGYLQRTAFHPYVSVRIQPENNLLSDLFVKSNEITCAKYSRLLVEPEGQTGKANRLTDYTHVSKTKIWILIKEVVIFFKSFV
jgi:hypothetical protein